MSLTPIERAPKLKWTRDPTRDAWIHGPWAAVVIGTDSGGRPVLWGLEKDGVSITKETGRHAGKTPSAFVALREAKEWAERKIAGVEKPVAPGLVARAKLYSGPMPDPKLMVLEVTLDNPFGNGHKNPAYDFQAAKKFEAGERFVIGPDPMTPTGDHWRPVLMSYRHSGRASEGSEIWNLLFEHLVEAPQSLDSVLVAGYGDRRSCDTILERLLAAGKLDYAEVRAAMLKRGP